VSPNRYLRRCQLEEFLLRSNVNCSCLLHINIAVLFAPQPRSGLQSVGPGPPAPWSLAPTSPPTTSPPIIAAEYRHCLSGGRPTNIPSIIPRHRCDIAVTSASSSSW